MSTTIVKHTLVLCTLLLIAGCDCTESPSPYTEKEVTLTIAPYRGKIIPYEGGDDNYFIGYVTLSEGSGFRLLNPFKGSIKGLDDIYQEGNQYTIRALERTRVIDSSPSQILASYRLLSIISQKPTDHVDLKVRIDPKGTKKGQYYFVDVADHGPCFHLPSIEGFDDLYREGEEYTLLIRAEYDPSLKSPDEWPTDFGPYSYRLLKIL